MANDYLWATSDGSIIEAEYNENVDRLTHEQVKAELISALQQYGHTVTCEPVSDDPKEEVYIITVQGSEYEPFFVCIKEMTPGGRSALKDEQRVQQQSQYINFAYSKVASGSKSVMLGVYKRGGDTIFCAWKLKESTAKSGVPISKQIKIKTIASAMKEGFVQQEKDYGEYACAFRREFIYFYIRNSDWLHGETVRSALIENDASIIHSSGEIDEDSRIKGGDNYLLYGVPGSGKSYTVKTEYCNDEKRMERVVFHPDYTYSDFVGQIMPKLDEEQRVIYEFAPGPFTRMLKKSYLDPSEEYFLIIEELNRGNAPAIFGEVFQLLDRIEKADEGAVGESSYGITNAYIAKYVYKDEEHLVRIPSNLNIIATMNTSDQNVFTLDTAFQRRWHMRMIENNINEAKHANAKILDTNVTWAEFNIAINEKILEANASLSSSEDKRLGAYFVTSSELSVPSSQNDEESDKQISRFPEKVLKYLWGDAFKFARELIFDEDSGLSLEDIIQTFKSNKGNARFSKIFKEGVLDITEKE